MLNGKDAVGGKKEPARIDEEIVKLGNKTLDAIIVKARKILQKNKSIDAYFWSRGTLLKAKTDLLKKIPETKAKMGEAIAQLDKEVRSRYSSYDFGEKGYPLSPSDQKLFDRVRNVSSVNDVFSGACKEECLIIPNSLPSSADMTAVVNVRLTLVFNATQPRGRKHCIIMVAEKDGATFKHETPIASPRVKQAHASYSFRKPLSALGEGAGPISQNGESIILYYLAGRDPNEQEWRPLSLAAKVMVGK